MNRKPSLKAKRPMPKMSAKRLAEFEALGIRPASTFRPKPPKASTKGKAYKPTGPDPHTVDLVLARDHYQCVICGDPLHGTRSIDYSIHHRKLRSGGVDNRPSNLISLCGSGTTRCHGEVHANPEKARQGGWMLRRTDSTEKPVIHFLYQRRVQLTDDGEVKYEEASA